MSTEFPPVSSEFTPVSSEITPVSSEFTLGNSKLTPIRNSPPTENSELPGQIASLPYVRSTPRVDPTYLVIGRSNEPGGVKDILRLFAQSCRADGDPAYPAA